MYEEVFEVEEMLTECDCLTDEEHEDVPALTLECWLDVEMQKLDDLEVASTCTSTTADVDYASTVSDFLSCSEASAAPCVADVPPLLWQAALIRAELSAIQYRLREDTKTVPDLKTEKLEEKPKSEDEKFFDELARTHQVHVEYDEKSLSDSASRFEKMRWQFLKEFGHSICRPVAEGYGTTWTLKPTPLNESVQQKFLDACSCSEKEELQPAPGPVTQGLER